MVRQFERSTCRSPSQPPRRRSGRSRGTAGRSPDPPEPGVCGEHEVTQGLGQRPFVLDVGVHQRCGRARHRRRPCRLHRDPPVPQALGRPRLLQFPPREPPIELGVHQRHDVDTVDHHAGEEQIMAVDVESSHVDAAHRHPADIARPQGGTPEARSVDRRPFELATAAVHCHPLHCARRHQRTQPPESLSHGNRRRTRREPPGKAHPVMAADAARTVDLAATDAHPTRIRRPAFDDARRWVVPRRIRTPVRRRSVRRLGRAGLAAVAALAPVAGVRRAPDPSRGIVRTSRPPCQPPGGRGVLVRCACHALERRLCVAGSARCASGRCSRLSSDGFRSPMVCQRTAARGPVGCWPSLSWPAASIITGPATAC